MLFNSREILLSQQKINTEINIENKALSNEELSVFANLTLNTKEIDNSLRLLYKNAVAEIDKILYQDKGINSTTQKAIDTDMDFSPTATATRIFDFAIAFYPGFRHSHLSEDEYQTKKAFTEIIKDAIDEGFNEAKDILESLSVLKGDILENIHKTYDLIQVKLDDFLNPLTTP